MRLLKLLYEVLLDWIKDLKNTRHQLVWISMFLFMWSVLHGVETPVLLTVAGLLTICWTFFFAANHQRFKQNHEKELQKGIKIIAPVRDPDED